MTTHYVTAPGTGHATVVMQPHVVQPTGVTAAPYSAIDDEYNAVSSKNLGLTQIACAAIVIVLNIIGIVIECSSSDVGYGFWNGAMVGVCGILGVYAKNKRKSAITAYQVTSIFGMISGCIIGLIGIVAVTTERIKEAMNAWNWWDPNARNDDDGDDDSGRSARVAVDSMMILVSLLINASFIWTFCITCSCCRSTPTSTGTVITTTFVQPGAQQVVQTPAYSSAQPGVAPNPPAYNPGAPQMPVPYGVSQPVYQQ